MATKLQFFMRQTVEVENADVRIEAAVRYEEEDMPHDFYGREGDTWRVTVGLETGVIAGWPKGLTKKLHMKVCDEGHYVLYFNANQQVAMNNEYVPGGFPGSHYGDYLIFDIDGTGKINGWNGARVLASFQEYANCKDL